MDAQGVAGFQLFSGSDATAYLATGSGAQLSAFTSYNQGAFVNFIVPTSSFADAADTTGSVSVVYQIQPTDQYRGDFEDANPEPNSLNAPSIAIPEINVQMKSSAIVAKTRKLKAVWTPEFAQDLNAYHSIDAEAELTSILSEYCLLYTSPSPRD